MEYNSYQANNDFEMGETHDEVIDDLEFELRTGTPGALQIRSDLSKEDALKLIDNLRWLAEQSYDR
jgi:hypothetical protein